MCEQKEFDVIIEQAKRDSHMNPSSKRLNHLGQKYKGKHTTETENDASVKHKREEEDGDDDVKTFNSSSSSEPAAKRTKK